MQESPIQKLFDAISKYHSLTATAKEVGVSRQCLYQYKIADKFPRSDLIGVTNYAKKIVKIANFHMGEMSKNFSKSMRAFKQFSDKEILSYTQKRWEEDEVPRQLNINKRRKK